MDGEWKRKQAKWQWNGEQTSNQIEYVQCALEWSMPISNVSHIHADELNGIAFIIAVAFAFALVCPCHASATDVMRPSSSLFAHRRWNKVLESTRCQAQTQSNQTNPREECIFSAYMGKVDRSNGMCGRKRQRKIAFRFYYRSERFVQCAQ